MDEVTLECPNCGHGIVIPPGTKLVVSPPQVESLVARLAAAEAERDAYRAKWESVQQELMRLREAERSREDEYATEQPHAPQE